MADNFRLEIVTPLREVYSGEVSSLKVPAYEGSMGILAHHTPILAELTPGSLEFTTSSGEQKLYSISGGFLEVGENRAIALSDTAESPDEIDIERAEESHRRAKERMAQAGADLDVKRCRIALQRAIARLRVVGKY